MTPKRVLSPEQAEKARERTRRARSERGDEIRAQRRRNSARPEHRERMREARLLRKYGITLYERDQLAEAQEHTCLVCGSQDRPLVVDHDHTHGWIRGFLCSNCNTAIGLLQDNPRTCEHAAVYLRWAEKNHLPLG